MSSLIKDGMITCSMCGARFDPSEHAACRACPLQKDCHLVCCPVCGYETVDASKSRLARLVARWLSPDPPDELDAKRSLLETPLRPPSHRDYNE